MITSERGGALLIALALMAMLSIIAVVASNRSHTEMEMSYNNLHTDQSFYVADGGLKRALTDLNVDNDWRTGYDGEEMNRGTYWVTLEDSLDNTALFDTVIVRSTAVVANGKSSIEGVVVPVYNHPFQYALFGDQSVVIQNRTTTDSYNSDSGTYADSHLLDDGDVGSNGTVVIQDRSTIYGDAVSAVEGGVTIENISVVTGDTATGVEPSVIDIIPDEEYDWAESVSDAPSGFIGSGYTYDHTTKDLTIGEYDSLILTSGVYYFNDIHLENYSQIKINEGDNVTIYMNGNILLENASKMNAGGAPEDMIVFSRGDEFKMENQTTFVGAFYSPTATFWIENNTDLFGSIVASDIILENQAGFHYDRSLSDYAKGTTGEMILVAWREM